MASAKPKRGARFRSGLIGLLMFVAAGFFLYVALNAQKGLPFAQHEFRTAAVSDTGDLAVGNDVRVGQVRVGRVDDITIADGVPQVRMQLDDAATEVFRDGSAAVTGRSGLGQQYLDLDIGHEQAGVLGEDDVLPVQRSRGAVQLLDLAEVFDPATQDATRGALQQLGNGAAGHGQDVADVAKAGPQILPSLGTTARSLSVDGGRDLTAMLQSLESLSSRSPAGSRRSPRWSGGSTPRSRRSTRTRARRSGTPSTSPPKRCRPPARPWRTCRSRSRRRTRR